MVGSKSRLPVPAGFTDFKWKKGRFISNYNYNEYKRHVYQVYDTKTDDRWFIDYNCNNLHTDDLGVILNNLYERNGYLRRECSKQTFLANQYKEEADFWHKVYLNEQRDCVHETNEANHYYNQCVILESKIHELEFKLKQQNKEVDWGEFDSQDINK